MIPPVQVWTAPDDEAYAPERRLTVNRADRGDSNVVISFADRNNGSRDAIGIPPDEAILFATALLIAAQEVKG